MNAVEKIDGLAIHRHPAINPEANSEHLVLLHGWGGDSTTWQPLLKDLQQLGSVMMIDLPGFGASEHFTLTDLDSLLELLQQKLPERATLLGWSLGGMLAVALAARAPQSVARVITLAANIKFVASASYVNAMPPAVNRNFNQSFSTDAQAALKIFSGLLAQGDANERSLMKTLRAHKSSVQPNDSWQGALTLLAEMDNRAGFKELSQPGLHILGEMDALVPVAVAESMRALNSLQHIEVVPQSAHAVHWSQPDKVIQLIRQFIKPAVLDKRKVAQSFSRAASTYDSVADLQRDVGTALMAKLPAGSSLEWIVDLGCGTGFFSQRLQAHFPSAKILGLDIAQGMVQFARRERGAVAQWLCGDAERLPLGDSSVDMVFSSLAIQWCDQSSVLFAELRRVLKPDGIVLFTTLGPRTLHELRSAWEDVDGYVHVNRFQSAGAVQQAICDSGLELIEWQVEGRVLRYQRLVELTRELKALGAHNINAGQSEGLTGRYKLEGLKRAYEKFRQDDYLPASYEVYYGLARAKKTH